MSKCLYSIPVCSWFFDGRPLSTLKKFLYLYFLYKCGIDVQLGAPCDTGDGCQNVPREKTIGYYDPSNQFIGMNTTDYFWVSRFDRTSALAKTKTVCFLLSDAAHKERILKYCPVIPVLYPAGKQQIGSNNTQY